MFFAERLAMSVILTLGLLQHNLNGDLKINLYSIVLYFLKFLSNHFFIMDFKARTKLLLGMLHFLRIILKIEQT